MYERRERQSLNYLLISSLSLLSLALVACAGNTHPKIEATATPTSTVPLSEVTPTLTPALLSTATPTLTTTPSSTSIPTAVFDYCHLDGKTDSPQITPTREPTYYENQPDKKALEKVNLKNTDFVFPTKKLNEREVQVILVGVKYQNSKKLNEDLKKINLYLTNVFKGIPVNFGYLAGRTLPVGILRFKDNNRDSAAIVSSSEDGHELKKKIDAVFPQTVNLPVFIVDADEYFGGAGKFIVSSRFFSELIVPHELAHGLCFGDPCIDDGYRSYYQPGAIPNSEIFTEGRYRSDIVPIVERLKPPIVKMEGAVCNGEPLYTFYEYPSSSVMGDQVLRFDNDGNLIFSQAYQGKVDRQEIFTPLQKAILTDKLTKLIEKTLTGR